MSESIPHVVSAIKTKRDEIVRQIDGLEVRLRALRSSLASLEAAAVILAPHHGAEFRKRRTRYFARNELSRMTLDALRNAKAPLSLRDLAFHAIKAKGLPASAEPAVLELLTGVLRKHAASGSVIKTGSTRDARWSLDSKNATP